jgi:tRNA threonylcarbamoyladenosine biosynthesis protein TsaE
VVHLIRFLSRSAEETSELGKKLGAVLEKGDVIALRGDLGSGKSVFARGILESMGVIGDKPSPSFVVVASYEAPVAVNHVDLFRLANAGEALDLGIEDLLYSGAVSIVEWADRMEGFLPPRAVDVEIRSAEDPGQRLIEITAKDADVKTRLTGLARELVRLDKR